MMFILFHAGGRYDAQYRNTKSMCQMYTFCDVDVIRRQCAGKLFSLIAQLHRITDNSFVS
jgi:hypothetical protein